MTTLYTPSRLKRWTRPQCYVGAEWSNYFGSGFGQHRDSDDLEQSNFAVVQRELAKLPKWEGEAESRFVVHESHWAVGWVEWLAIHETDTDALELCDDLRKKTDDYPPLDEEDWSNREAESANTVWRDCYNQAERVEYIRQHPDQFQFRGLRDAIRCIRGDYFAGYASELLN